MTKEQCKTTLDQIGIGNMMAISGLRVEYVASNIGVEGLRLPVAKGWHVTVCLQPNDTYTVSRCRARKGQYVPTATETDVHYDQVSDSAYRASLYEDFRPFGQAPV